MADLSEYLLRRLPLHRGITRVRTHVATRVYDASRRWRLRILNREQACRLAPAVPPRLPLVKGLTAGAVK